MNNSMKTETNHALASAATGNHALASAATGNHALASAATGNHALASAATIPLPRHLGYLNDPGRRPLHVGTREVRELVEYWGYTRNGEEHVKKLIRCGALVPVKLKQQRGNRYPVEMILGLWEG